MNMGATVTTTESTKGVPSFLGGARRYAERIIDPPSIMTDLRPKRARISGRSLGLILPVRSSARCAAGYSPTHTVRRQGHLYHPSAGVFGGTYSRRIDALVAAHDPRLPDLWSWLVFVGIPFGQYPSRQGESKPRVEDDWLGRTEGRVILRQELD